MKDKSIRKNPALLSAFDRAKKGNGRVHFLGLVFFFFLDEFSIFFFKKISISISIVNPIIRFLTEEFIVTLIIYMDF